MALAGPNTQCYFFWLLAILSIIYSIAGLVVFSQPYQFFPTPNNTEYEAQSRLFLEAEGNVPVQRSTPRIYMLNLPRRTDRRERMMKLQAATGLSWIFVDSTDSKAEIVTQIMERVRWIRAAAHLHAIDANFHGWWSDHHDNAFESTHLLNGSESELWELVHSNPASADHTHPLPVPPSLDQRPPLKVATSRIIPPGATWDSGTLNDSPLSNTNPNSVRTATRDVTNTLAPRLPKLPFWRILTRAAIACWYSHICVIREIASETIQAGTSDTGVLILEDDIDMEIDIRQRIGRLWEALPPDWDILFLGHCWSAEDTYPALRSHDQLHPSHSPKCTHAYALSRKGARRLVQLLRDPSVAYGRPLDAAFLDLIQSNLLNAYSVHPSIVIQTKDTPSDIFPGNGSRWRDVLQMPALSGTGKFWVARHFHK
ncbi:hypothetical protein RSOLAG22IIIB_06775 [Rhizoctonia solani]|uniref:Glycosyltransferase family 25 protein n=1 Tax=Rhizoctonia solani TaxID=456999 RepID=A0A0K6GGM2_9AGAM|nr:hypothetical protein RSOLAG22IIIB_06775 [Rhizoctonia solani]